MSFTDKVIAVTGGASGIGLATVKILASKGAKLSIADVNKDNLAGAKKSVEDAGAECLTTVVDVTQSKQVDDWIATTVKHFGRLDGAANCAGIGNPKTPLIVDTTDEDWLKVQNVNINGVFFSIRAQLRVMSDNGAIVNIASVAGLKGFPTQASYGASKFGVVGLSKTAALESGHRHIRVNAIAPGLIDTPLTEINGPAGVTKESWDQMLMRVPLKRNGKPEEVGQLIAWLLSSDSSYVNGSVQVVDGGMMA